MQALSLLEALLFAALTICILAIVRYAIDFRNAVANIQSVHTTFHEGKILTVSRRNFPGLRLLLHPLGNLTKLLPVLIDRGMTVGISVGSNYHFASKHRRDYWPSIIISMFY
jgi:hypothetical protein